MGLLDFLKKDEYKSGNQGQVQPVNLGQQPATQSPLLPGSAPAPIPSSNPTAAQQNPVGNQPIQNPQTQIQPYSTPAENTFNPIPEQPVQQMQSEQNNAFQPIPEVQPTQQNAQESMQDLSAGQPVNQTQTKKEETIFGEGDLSDIYSQKFPNPQNIQPTTPGQSTAPANMNIEAEQVASIPDENPSAPNPMPVSTPAEPVPTFNDLSNDSVQTHVTPAEDTEVPTVQSQLDKADAAPSPKPTPQFEMPKIDMDAIMSSTQKAIEATKQKSIDETETQGQIKSESDIPQAKEIDSKPAIETITKPALNTAIKLGEDKKEDLKPKPKPQRNVFSKIGILGLDGPNMNSIDSEGVTQMSKSLLENKVELVFDTDKGIVPKVISMLKNPKFKISTVSLQPLLSIDGAEKVNTKSQSNNFAIVYSNFVEWLKHMIKESRMFIVFDGAGLDNHTMLLNLINISKMYGENGKPIILIGESWKAKIDTLKKSVVLADTDLASISILNNTDELQAKLDELNAKYSANKEPQYARVVDRRVEGDEKEFTVY